MVVEAPRELVSSGPEIVLVHIVFFSSSSSDSESICGIQSNILATEDDSDVVEFPSSE